MEVLQDERPLNIDEAAQFIGASRRTVYRLIKMGLKAYNIGGDKRGQLRFYPSEINSFIKSNRP